MSWGHSWLAVGFALWAEHFSERSYFLCLPKVDRVGVRFVEAAYSDAACVSRALSQSLTGFKATCGEHTSLETLFGNVALPFWAEHSSRASLPSWAACADKFPSDWVDLMDR